MGFLDALRKALAGKQGRTSIDASDIAPSLLRTTEPVTRVVDSELNFISDSDHVSDQRMTATTCGDDRFRASILTLEGDEERTVYTYDGAPLKGTRKGSKFYVEVVTSPVHLHSEATGSDWDGSTGGVALAYNGRVFGMTGALEKTFREIAAAGYWIRIKAKRVGMYCEGIPEIVLMIPDPAEIFLWRDACKGLGREVPFDERHSQECEHAAELERTRWHLSKMTGVVLPLGVDGDTLFVEDDEWVGDKPAAGTVKVDISTELIPTPKGSSAKPHVLVRCCGKAFRELSARNRQHALFLKHVGDTPYLATCKKHVRDDGTYCWKVTVVFMGQLTDDGKTLASEMVASVARDPLRRADAAGLGSAEPVAEAPGREMSA